MQGAVVGAVGVGVGPRAVAIIIDSILISIVGYIIYAALGSEPYVFFAILTLLYFPVMEKVWGQTVGKMAMKLKVVTESGQPISWGQAIIRTLLRIIDGLFVYLIGSIFVWTSPKKQRLGDRAAKTLVVKKDAAMVPATTGQF
jgi:uncharacterized RDD family membrane protein YckC